MGDGSDSGIEFLICGEFVDYFETIFAADGGGVGPGVEDSDVEVILAESADDVNNLGVANVGAVLLKGEAEDDYVTTKDLYAFFEHQFDDAVGNVCPHTVVHAASGKDDLGIIAVTLGTLRKVVRVNADTVSADKSGFEWQEVPFC